MEARDDERVHGDDDIDEGDDFMGRELAGS
jgi:hypothetical protein